MGIFGKTDSRPVETPRHVTPPSPAITPTAPVVVPQQPARGAAPAAVATVQASTCVIGPKTHIKGEITGEENVRVEGHVEGNIKVGRDLHVGTGGTVKANVTAQSVVIAGELLGDCQATQRVQIEPTGRLTGNIRAPRVVILEGATFRGNSDMSQRREGEA